jgi:hypothetical protein
MMSWSARAARRGAGTRLFHPPGEAELHEGWHQVETHIGPLRLHWRPGTATWHSAEGMRWTDASAAEFHWKYVGAEVAAS